MAIDKSTQKRNSYNSVAIEQVAKKYGVTPRYVRSSLKGDRKGIIPDRLIADYKALDSELKSTLETFKNQ
ncbi:hypothetical protein CMT52_07680 [Elizabethkingia anophelis]|nr:hypothetical protein [Elizabethkingia anophelis]